MVKTSTHKYCLYKFCLYLGWGPDMHKLSLPRPFVRVLILYPDTSTLTNFSVVLSSKAQAYCAIEGSETRRLHVEIWSKVKLHPLAISGISCMWCWVQGWDSLRHDQWDFGVQISEGQFSSSHAPKCFSPRSGASQTTTNSLRSCPLQWGPTC